jgi:hypothetical protein
LLQQCLQLLEKILVATPLATAEKISVATTLATIGKKS